MGTDMTLRNAVAALLLIVTAVPAQAQAQLRVFACEPEWAALVRALVPDAALTTATSYLQDPHYIEARPSLIAAVRRADIAVCTGASLEAGWLPTLLQRAANPRIQPGRPGLFFAADYARLYAPHDHVDRSMGDVHPEGNPHVHLSPDDVPGIAGALTERLIDLRPEAAADIRARYIRWRGHWNRQKAEWREQARMLAGRSLVVQHSTFWYLLNWLGVEVTADLEPKPGLPPGAGYLSRLLQNPAVGEASAILVARHQDPAPAEWLASRTALPVVILPGTVTESGETDTLGKLISHLIAALISTAGESPRGGS